MSVVVPAHESRPARVHRGRSAQLAKADQKLALQQQEIDALERQVQSLSESKEMHAVKKARKQSLAELRSRAAKLLDEVKERQASRQPAGVEQLAHSVQTLTKDMSNVDAKVDKLTQVVEKKKDDDAFGAEVPPPPPLPHPLPPLPTARHHVLSRTPTYTRLLQTLTLVVLAGVLMPVFFWQ